MLKKTLLLVILVSFNALNAFTLESNMGNEYLEIDPNFKNERKADWIGVYKKGTSTAWENVVQWFWAKDKLSNTSRYTVENLEWGTYEVRYFLNNSFNLYARSEKFHIWQQ